MIEIDYSRYLQHLEGEALLKQCTNLADYYGTTWAVLDPRPVPGTEHTFRVAELHNYEGVGPNDPLVKNVFYDTRVGQFFYATNPFDTFTCFPWDSDYECHDDCYCCDDDECPENPDYGGDGDGYDDDPFDPYEEDPYDPYDDDLGEDED